MDAEEGTTRFDSINSRGDGRGDDVEADVVVDDNELERYREKEGAGEEERAEGSSERRLSDEEQAELRRDEVEDVVDEVESERDERFRSRKYFVSGRTGLVSAIFILSGTFSNVIIDGYCKE